MEPAETKAEGTRLRRQQIINAYPALWRRMLSERGEPANDPRAWLMYSASYLFRTGAVCWAIDPVRLIHRLPDAAGADYARDLSALSFVLLTHQHGDHLDLRLIRDLAHLPLTWIVPEPIQPLVVQQAGLRASQIITPRALVPIELHGIRITPFHAMHWEARRGVPETGYMVESAGKRWLFPGDTRDYSPGVLPDFGPVDILFAHVWLGRASALLARPPLLNAFSKWCLSLHPERIILTHLEEYGRTPDELWDVEHAKLITARLAELRPEVAVQAAVMGDSVSL